MITPDPKIDEKKRLYTSNTWKCVCCMWRELRLTTCEKKSSKDSFLTTEVWERPKFHTKPKRPKSWLRIFPSPPHARTTFVEKPFLLTSRALPSRLRKVFLSSPRPCLCRSRRCAAGRAAAAGSSRCPLPDPPRPAAGRSPSSGRGTPCPSRQTCR